MSPLTALPATFLFLGLIVIGAFIDVPLPWFPFNLEFFFLLLSLLILGPAASFFALALYLVLGLSGLPVFTHGGGLGYLKEAGFGFLLGFLLFSYPAGSLLQKVKTKKINLYFFVSGMIIIGIHLIAYFYNFALHRFAIQIEPFSWTVMLQRIVPEILMAMIASWIAFKIHSISSKYQPKWAKRDR